MGDMKERILFMALEMFAREGYEAVSMRDIAGALGVTQGALYKHYRNKQAILESIIARMERQDAAQAAEHQLPQGMLADMEEAYRSAAEKHILSFSQAMFYYWTRDPFASQFRRMLTIEQFRNKRMGELYQQYLGSGPVGYLTDLFSSRGDACPRRRAVEMYAPMTLLYSLYDGGVPPDETDALLKAALERAIQKGG